MRECGAGGRPLASRGRKGACKVRAKLIGQDLARLMPVSSDRAFPDDHQHPRPDLRARDGLVWHVVPRFFVCAPAIAN